MPRRHIPTPNRRDIAEITSHRGADRGGGETGPQGESPLPSASRRLERPSSQEGPPAGLYTTVYKRRHDVAVNRRRACRSTAPTADRGTDKTARVTARSPTSDIQTSGNSHRGKKKSYWTRKPIGYSVFTAIGETAIY